jgi:hypothetical protein
MRRTVFKQFENPEATKREDETASQKLANEKIRNATEKAARKAAKTEQENENDRMNFAI